jgi:glyceraldehyde 3-phosphate dehydrogenase
MAFRVPTVDVFVVDIPEIETSYDNICQVMKEASENQMKGILSYCDEPVVSTDLIGKTHSSIFDSMAGIPLTSTFYKIVSWYDNEKGYSERIVDLIHYMSSYH